MLTDRQVTTDQFSRNVTKFYFTALHKYDDMNTADLMNMVLNKTSNLTVSNHK